MRPCLTVCLATVSACSSPAPQATNESGANVVHEQAASSSTKVVANDVQSDEVKPKTKAHPCLDRGGEAVTHIIKALGTEPFWAVEVEGRCVTYKTPEDQQGTRIWTEVTRRAPETVWDGALRGRQFLLTIRPKADCSDGMSDKSYPLEAVLRVDGETRHGCAERL